jgi:WD40 repeat protein
MLIVCSLVCYDNIDLIMSTVDKVSQDLMESLGVQITQGEAAGAKGPRQSSGRRGSGTAADMLHARLAARGPAQLESKRSKPPIKQTVDKVPDYVQKALSIPPSVPNLGLLRPDVISTSSFFKNHHRLEPGSGDPNDPRAWRPKGVLVSTLLEHKSSVNQLAVSRDNLFLASGSDDGTVKIWDIGRLKVQPHATSQLTYSQGGRITSVVLCDSSHSVASASDRGSVHVFRVEYAPAVEEAAPRYTALSEVKNIDTGIEGSVLTVEHFNTVSESLLTYGTRRGIIHGWDLRSRHEAFKITVDPSMGLLSSMNIGPSPYCLVGGSTRGFIGAWDLRFQIPIQLWRHNAKSRILSLTPQDTASVLPRNPKTGHWQHPTKGPLLFAAAEGTNQISGFDMYTGECRVVFRVLTAGNKASLANVMRKKKPSAVLKSPPLQPSLGSPNKAAGSNGETTSSSGAPKSGRARSLKVSPLSLPSLRSYIGADSKLPTLDTQFVKEMVVAPEMCGVAQPSVSSFLCCKESMAITAGTDRSIRFWDLRDAADSYRYVIVVTFFSPN